MKHLLIFKTNIATQKKVKAVRPVFNRHPIIADWSVDTEDIDKVLRIETAGNLNETDVINLLNPLGFYCEGLPD